MLNHDNPFHPIDAIDDGLEYRYHTIGKVFIGPLTKDQQESCDRYEAYCREVQEEHEARQAAGGREVCPKCGERAVRSRDVVTLGYAGHPGAEYSVLRKCENCDHEEL